MHWTSPRTRDHEIQQVAGVEVGSDERRVGDTREQPAVGIGAGHCRTLQVLVRPPSLSTPTSSSADSRPSFRENRPRALSGSSSERWRWREKVANLVAC